MTSLSSYIVDPLLPRNIAQSGSGARAGAADTLREEGLADVISMHSLLTNQILLTDSVQPVTPYN